MAAVVGSLLVELQTDNAGLAKALKASGRDISAFESKTKKSLSGANQNLRSSFASQAKAVGVLTSAIGSFGKAVIAGGAIAALGSFTGAIAKARSAIAEFDQISKTARTVGLSGETYQALSFGALEASVSQEKLNTALSAFVRNSGLAATGKGELVEKLRQLNPELLKNILAARDQEQRIRLVADALNQASNASARAALASAAFGESGVELVRVFAAGAAAIDDMKRRARDLGLIVPDDLLQRAEELDNKLSVLAKVVDVNLSTALVKLAPLLVAGSQGAADMATEVNRLSQAVDDFRRNPDLDSFLSIFNVALIEGGLADKFRDFINAGLVESKRTASEIRAEIESVESKIADLQALGDGDIFAQTNIDRETERLGELKAELGSVERAAAAAAKNAGSSLRDLAKSATDAIDGVSAAVAEQAEEAARYQSVLDQVNRAASSIGGGADFREQTAALAEYVNRARNAAAATDTITTAQDQLRTIAAGALKELASATDLNSAAYARAQTEIDGIAEALERKGTKAEDVVIRLKNVESSLRALGVGESVISRLVTAFGTLAGNILSAKAALDAYNAVQVGAGGSRAVQNGIGVTKFTSQELGPSGFPLPAILEPRICAEITCGKVFQPQHRKSKFCGHTCAAKDSARRVKAEKPPRFAARPCAQCGTAFLPDRAAARFCSPGCNQKFQNAQRRLKRDKAA